MQIEYALAMAWVVIFTPVAAIVLVVRHLLGYRADRRLARDDGFTLPTPVTERLRPHLLPKEQADDPWRDDPHRR